MAQAARATSLSCCLRSRARGPPLFPRAILAPPRALPLFAPALLPSRRFQPQRPSKSRNPGRPGTSGSGSAVFGSRDLARPDRAQLESANSAGARTGTAASSCNDRQRLSTAESDVRGGVKSTARASGRDAVLRSATVSNRSVTSIDLDRNSVGDAGASALAAALRGNPTLTSLRYAHATAGVPFP